MSAAAFRQLHWHQPHHVHRQAQGARRRDPRRRPQSGDRNKATTTLDWDIAHVSTRLTWYYTGGYDQRPVTGAGIPTRVDAGNHFDLYVGCKGFEGWRSYAKAQNLLDEEPPYDPAGFAGLRAPYDISQYDLRGR